MQYDEKYTEYNEITLQGLSLWLNLVNWLMRTVKPKKRHKLRMGFDPNTNSEYVALDVRSYEDLSQVISDLGMKPEDFELKQDDRFEPPPYCPSYAKGLIVDPKILNGILPDIDEVEIRLFPDFIDSGAYTYSRDAGDYAEIYGPELMLSFLELKGIDLDYEKDVYEEACAEVNRVCGISEEEGDEEE